VKPVYVATRLERPNATGTPTRGMDRRTEQQDRVAGPGRRDLCTPGPGSMAERLGDRFSRVHPLLVGALVVLMGFVVLAGAAIGIGFLLTDVVLPGSIQRWDEGAVRALASGRPTFNTATLIGSYFAEFATVIIIGGIGIALAIWQHWYRLAVLFTIAIFLEGGIYLAATNTVVRERPNIPRLEHLVPNDSFPSGHVAASVVLWCFLALLVWNATTKPWARALAVVAFVLAPVVVALSRMYRGMHHPTDTMAGYAIGWGCVLVALLAVRAWAAANQRRELRKVSS
jgi:membrane-associated phospholipid phosphatase